MLPHESRRPDSPGSHVNHITHPHECFGCPNQAGSRKEALCSAHGEQDARSPPVGRGPGPQHRQGCTAGSGAQPGIRSRVRRRSWGQPPPWRGFHCSPGLGWGSCQPVGKTHRRTDIWLCQGVSCSQNEGQGGLLLSCTHCLHVCPGMCLCFCEMSAMPQALGWLHVSQ